MPRTITALKHILKWCAVVAGLCLTVHVITMARQVRPNASGEIEITQDKHIERIPNADVMEEEKVMFDSLAFQNRRSVVKLIDNASANLANDLKLHKLSCKSYLKEMFYSKEIVPFVVKPRDGGGIQQRLCLVSTITHSRLYQLEQLLRAWKGCITLMLYLEEEKTSKIIELLQQWIPSLHDQISIHFVYAPENKLLPINFLRNAALEMTKSDYVLYIDIDLVPTSGLYDKLILYIERNEFGIENNVALIIPAFALKSRDTALPQNKSDIINLVSQNKAEPFYIKEYRRAYGPTDYKHWMDTTEAYNVNIDCYNEFEPYMMVRNRGVFYSEVFLHRFLNKVIFFTELCLRGYKFIVEPVEFLTHVPHSHNKMSDILSKYFHVKECAYNSYLLHYMQSKKTYGYQSSSWIARRNEFVHTNKFLGFRIGS